MKGLNKHRHAHTSKFLFHREYHRKTTIPVSGLSDLSLTVFTPTVSPVSTSFCFSTQLSTFPNLRAVPTKFQFRPGGMINCMAKKNYKPQKKMCIKRNLLSRGQNSAAGDLPRLHQHPKRHRHLPVLLRRRRGGRLGGGPDGERRSGGVLGADRGRLAAVPSQVWVFEHLPPLPPRAHQETPPPDWSSTYRLPPGPNSVLLEEVCTSRLELWAGGGQFQQPGCRGMGGPGKTPRTPGTKKKISLPGTLRY